MDPLLSNMVDEEGRDIDMTKDKTDESLNEIDSEISKLTKFEKNVSA